MFDMLNRWYRRRFSDPHAVSLVAILLVGFITIYFFGNLLAPLLAAIVIAYLLDWPVNRLTRIGLPRTDVPNMFNNVQALMLSLPERYPELIKPHMINTFVDTLQNNVLRMGETLVKGSLSSLVNLVALAVYLVLVPLLVFFLLTDKQEMLAMFKGLLPRNRRLASRVGHEMNQQISNYIRGKVTEILIVGSVSYVTFSVLGLEYAVLLSVATGFSVLIPYIGAAVVTLPIAIVALFQWGLTPEFWYVMIAYGVIQALDGNVLVPVLFSEAVNLHPVAIIIAVLVFGGLWGFWGVFFAIPLATLVKAVWQALPVIELEDDPKPDAQ
jgi:putative permease